MSAQGQYQLVASFASVAVPAFWAVPVVLGAFELECPALELAWPVELTDGAEHVQLLRSPGQGEAEQLRLPSAQQSVAQQQVQDLGSAGFSRSFVAPA
mmetsp:Transcript_9093/g.17370  ORF Transcript_9093/g.17370 Transcript_9093/m.17370 type:complete len:98 (-) Transcript_9093:2278-2571(-)